MVWLGGALPRGTEPLEIADFQSDFDAVPEAGEWGCLHPGMYYVPGCISS